MSDREAFEKWIEENAIKMEHGPFSMHGPEDCILVSDLRDYLLKHDNLSLQAAQAGDGEAVVVQAAAKMVVDAWNGRMTMELRDALDYLAGSVNDEGYTAPPAAVNQQLLESRDSSEAPSQYNCQESAAWANGYNDCLAAIAAAQEQK